MEKRTPKIELGDWDIPIFDAPRVRLAIMRFPFFNFVDGFAREKAAKKIAEAAEKFGITP